MKEHVMSDGHQLPAEGIVRGRPIVWSEGEWRQRYMGLVRGRFLVNSIALLVMVGALFVPMFLLGDLPVIIVVALLVVLIYLFVHGTYRSTRDDILSGGPVPGLYANGIEMPIFPTYTARLFIPWDEMEDAWMQRSRLVDEVLFIAVRNSRWRWRFPRRLLGEEGAAVAVSRARQHTLPTISPPVTVPPRLVVYTAEGARTESTPDEA